MGLLRFRIPVYTCICIVEYSLYLSLSLGIHIHTYASVCIAYKKQPVRFSPAVSIRCSWINPNCSSFVGESASRCSAGVRSASAVTARSATCCRCLRCCTAELVSAPRAFHMQAFRLPAPSFHSSILGICRSCSGLSCGELKLWTLVYTEASIPHFGPSTTQALDPYICTLEVLTLKRCLHTCPPYTVLPASLLNVMSHGDGEWLRQYVDDNCAQILRLLSTGQAHSPLCTAISITLHPLQPFK